MSDPKAPRVPAGPRPIIGELANYATEDLTTRGLTCKETPINDLSGDGSRIGRTRECSVKGLSTIPTRPELMTTDTVITNLGRTSGVRHYESAEINWQGKATIAEREWNVLVVDREADGTIDEFTIVGPVTDQRVDFAPATYIFGARPGGGQAADGQSSCWKLRGGRDATECAYDLYQPVDTAYQTALVRLGFKNPDPPPPTRGRANSRP